MYTDIKSHTDQFEEAQICQKKTVFQEVHCEIFFVFSFSQTLIESSTVILKVLKKYTERIHKPRESDNSVLMDRCNPTMKRHIETMTNQRYNHCEDW